jgi:SAM-dependent methyltransferase
MPEAFEAAWLTQRRAADRQARSTELAEALAHWAAPRDGCRLLDLGAGSGANAAFLASFLPRPHHWCLVDHDAALLGLAADELAVQPGVTAATRVADLATVADWALEGQDVVTASALLDLVSAAWLEAVIAGAARERAALLFALSYNGEVSWSPRLPGDDDAREAFNAHQRRDKGLGAALGPNAPAVAAATARRYGYRVQRRATPWVLGASAAELQAALLAGRYQSALEQQPEDAAALAEWAAARQTRIDTGDSTVRVGHDDILALPP